MVHRVGQIVTRAVAVGLPVSSMALAGGNPDKSLAEERFEGTVTRIDAKGGAILTTKKGREYPVQATGLQLGDTIECGRHRDGTCEKIPAKTK